MKVYVAEKGYAYEGFEIIGIYSTRKLAEIAIEKNKGADKYIINEINEYEVLTKKSEIK